MSHPRFRTGLLAALLGVLLPVLPASAEMDLVVSDAWVREAPPGATVLAGYLKITNRGTAHATVSGVSAADFSSVEIHRTVMENGMARMLSAEQLEIPAGESFVLEPGGYHLMLFNPARPLAAGDSVELLLHVRDGACLAVDAPVARMTLDQHP
ncbi:MAG: copper chaperone PCu(A)C [Halobacteria archaeon]|nr:copper chaperone PCu(A)C [Halobacteria archaeon]